LKSPNRESARQDAIFLGWQRTTAGDALALYNVIVENHPSYHSTVSERTLRKLGLQIPPTPMLQQHEAGNNKR
jgi:hypothetical protein